jgi:pimeloyl-[acyl-carrier protein] methyl ester esterase
MSPILLLVHGWGFDAGFWAPLRAALPELDAAAWDLGFTGSGCRPPLPAGRPVIAVGHSFGFLWLLREQPVAWQRLVSINGFPRFTRGADFPQGVAPRLVDRMMARLSDDPHGVHAEFMARCGAARSSPPEFRPAALRDGLDGLAHWDERPATADLALAGQADPIVPAAMSEASFAAHTIAWHPGGHLLPLEDPAWCAAQLRRQAEEMA